MEVSTEISKEVLRFRQCVQQGQGLPGIPERVTHEALRVKLKMQWRSQEVRDVRNWNICQGKP
jgi:hypothetical protein